MAIARFDSIDDCEVAEIELVGSNGNRVTVRMLVDSGFTGASSFVLSDRLFGFALANLPSAHAAGALSGRQRRVVVQCRISTISFLCRTASMVWLA